MIPARHGGQRGRVSAGVAWFFTTPPRTMYIHAPTTPLLRPGCISKNARLDAVEASLPPPSPCPR